MVNRGCFVKGNLYFCYYPSPVPTWLMNLLSGEYECKLDPKGRLVLPAKVKANLPEASGNQLVLVRGFEPCLVLYPRESWRVIHDKVMALDEFNEEYRQFQRNFFRGMTEVELDNIGRFMLPRTMLRYSGIEKEAIIVGLGNRCEIWEPEKYEEYLIKDQQSFSKLAQKFLTTETPAGASGQLAA